MCYTISKSAKYSPASKTPSEAIVSNRLSYFSLSSLSKKAGPFALCRH